MDAEKYDMNTEKYYRQYSENIRRTPAKPSHLTHLSLLSGTRRKKKSSRIREEQQLQRHHGSIRERTSSLRGDHRQEEDATSSAAVRQMEQRGDNRNIRGILSATKDHLGQQELLIGGGPPRV
ncbi:hypothetical protein EAG_07176 [Camponotus floridanus]|uniref:Uncharacterized protein n=1 Tax=Camponotus floridanus TaxID=104421 RepID=E1ZX32_CAMFO|nr:hypothetical protein EAG_07176 [Camponotus floridanus]